MSECGKYLRLFLQIFHLIYDNVADKPDIYCIFTNNVKNKIEKYEKRQEHRLLHMHSSTAQKIHNNHNNLIVIFYYSQE